MSELFTFEGFKKSDLCHHGIIGQKWGVRRYQNPDGSLTAEGKLRYLNSDGTLNKKGKKKIDTEKYANYKKEALLRTEKEREENFRKRKEANEFLKNAVLNKDDVFDHSKMSSKKLREDPKLKKKYDKTADLGIEALKKMREIDDAEIESEGRDGLRGWFMKEDQTFGMPSVATMINNGKSADYVKKLITSIENGDVDPKKSLEPQWSTFMFEVQEGNYGHRLEKFADACEKVKNDK